VLVVDDEPEVREMVRRLLADGGWTVRVADDRASALALVHQEPDLDLVLTDHRMPGGSGLDLASDLRALRPELPVVLMSGFVAEHQLLDAAAVVDVIAKPFTGDELVRVLRRHVRA
jgi:CheY-like chemotaxis protein